MLGYSRPFGGPAGISFLAVRGVASYIGFRRHCLQPITADVRRISAGSMCSYGILLR